MADRRRLVERGNDQGRAHRGEENLALSPINHRPFRPGTVAHARSGPPARRWGSFPTTADVGIWATGADAAALLEALGLGLFALLTDLRRVRPREERSISASARDPAELVVAFLNELLVLQSADGFLVRRLGVRTIGRPPTALVAAAVGEPFDRARHVVRTEVKAVTYHGLVFDPARHRARVIVDI